MRTIAEEKSPFAALHPQTARLELVMLSACALMMMMRLRLFLVCAGSWASLRIKCEHHTHMC